MNIQLRSQAWGHRWGKYQILFDVLSGYQRTISIVESATVRSLNFSPDIDCIPHDVHLLVTTRGGVQKLVDGVNGVSPNQRESSERSGVLVTN